MSNIRDIIEIEALRKYLLDVKPFHTKILNTINNYQFNDDISSHVTDSVTKHITQSNMWDYEYVANGSVTRFRIPATVIPRESATYTRFTFTGADSVHGNQIFALPFNNGIKSLKINGALKTESIDYTESEKRTRIYLTDAIADTDIIEVNVYSMDQLYISIDDVWQAYTITGFNYLYEKIDPTINDYTTGSFDVVGYNDSEFDDGSTIVVDRSIELSPLGRIIVLKDVNDGDYYMFEFDTPPANETRIKFKIIQDESARNNVRTYVQEYVQISDLVRFNENILVKIIEPLVDTYDGLPFELIGIDEHQNIFDIRPTSTENTITRVNDSISFTITDIPSNILTAENGDPLSTESGNVLLI